MNNDEKKVCPRCNTCTYLEKHHILPQAKFYGAGKIIEICPNCHNELHKELGKSDLKNPDPDYHQFYFWKWFFTASLCVALMVGVFAFFREIVF